MQRSVIIVVFFISSFLQANAQERMSLHQFFSDSISAGKASATFERFVTAQCAARFKDDKAFLQHLFKSTHKTFLKKYAAYTTVSTLFQTGRFDCLSATSLFSLVLKRFNFEFSIMETNYHIFIIVKTSKGNVLLETTDRLEGFVADEKSIDDRIGKYRQNMVTNTKDEAHVYQYRTSIYHALSPGALPGLMSFNLAILSYNNKEWKACAVRIEEARKTYSSPRIEELATILIQTVAAVMEDDSEKQMIISKMKRYASGRTLAGL